MSFYELRSTDYDVFDESRLDGFRIRELLDSFSVFIVGELWEAETVVEALNYHANKDAHETELTALRAEVARLREEKAQWTAKLDAISKREGVDCGSDACWNEWGEVWDILVAEPPKPKEGE